MKHDLDPPVRITMGRATRRRVPYLRVAPIGGAPPPAVLMVHGMRGTKEQLLPHMLAFAAAGVCAISIDAQGHGERWQPWQRAGMDGGRGRGAAYFMNLVARLALETADDITAVSRWLRAGPEIDGRVALWGVSLGANAVLAATPLVKPAAVAAAYGHGDWNRMWSLSWPAFHPREPAPPLGWDAGVRRLIARLEPINRAAEFFPSALLAVHGANDRPMVDGMRSLHKALVPHYLADRRRLQFKIYRSGHAFEASAADDMRHWVCRWLASN